MNYRCGSTYNPNALLIRNMIVASAMMTNTMRIVLGRMPRSRCKMVAGSRA